MLYALIHCFVFLLRLLSRYGQPIASKKCVSFSNICFQFNNVFCFVLTLCLLQSTIDYSIHHPFTHTDNLCIVYMLHVGASGSLARKYLFKFRMS